MMSIMIRITIMLVIIVMMMWQNSLTLIDYQDEYNDNHEGGNADENGNDDDTHDLITVMVTMMTTTSRTSSSCAVREGLNGKKTFSFGHCPNDGGGAYQIIVADAADAVSVNFSGRCKFLQI